jgi:mycothiol S-conjugate amidase
MTVQAHPDDEVTSGGGTMVRYRAEGVQTVLVTCTDGAEGEIHDPDLDENEARPRLPQIRAEELARAVKIMNFSVAVNLGYRDSGMVGTPANENPASFHQANMREATGRLVKLIRQYRPQVLFTYNSFGGYGHPDHIKAHKITSAAFDYAADTRRYPEAEFGPAWQPSKLYTVAWSRSSWNAVWEAIRAAGEPWPFGEEENNAEDAPEWGSPDSEITTIIDVSDYYKTAYEALKEHRTQIDPNSPFTQVMQKYGHLANRNEYFILFKSLVPAQRPEYDLFAGLR